MQDAAQTHTYTDMHLMPAAWQQVLESRPLFFAGDEQVVVSSEQEDPLLNLRQQRLHHAVALLQQLQLPLQRCWRQDLGQVAQLRYQLLQTVCILGSLCTTVSGA